MKRFFSITAVVMLLVVLVMGSCEKQDENQNAIEFLKNNATLEQVGFQTDEGLVGDLYSNNDQQVVLLGDTQPKTIHEESRPTGSFSWIIDGLSITFACIGAPLNCSETEDYIIIYK